MSLRFPKLYFSVFRSCFSGVPRIREFPADYLVSPGNLRFQQAILGVISALAIAL